MLKVENLDSNNAVTVHNGEQGSVKSRQVTVGGGSSRMFSTRDGLTITAGCEVTVSLTNQSGVPIQVGDAQLSPGQTFTMPVTDDEPITVGDVPAPAAAEAKAPDGKTAPVR